MTCRLLKEITHTCEYNSGGIAEIFLMDMASFGSYKFLDDRLYDSCLVEKILQKTDLEATCDLISLGVVNDSNFTEQESNDIYNQTLSTFVRSLSHEKLAQLLLLKARKNLVIFKTLQDKWFTFGSDVGATLSFEQVSGQLGESNGYKISIKANSVFPLFELVGEPNWNPDPDPETKIISVLGTENEEVVMSEDQAFAFEIYN